MGLKVLGPVPGFECGEAAKAPERCVLWRALFQIWPIAGSGGIYISGRMVTVCTIQFWDFGPWGYELRTTVLLGGDGLLVRLVWSAWVWVAGGCLRVAFVLKFAHHTHACAARFGRTGTCIFDLRVTDFTPWLHAQMWAVRAVLCWCAWVRVAGGCSRWPLWCVLVGFEHCHACMRNRTDRKDGGGACPLRGV
jgi:hypothetical protein